MARRGRRRRANFAYDSTQRTRKREGARSCCCAINAMLCYAVLCYAMLCYTNICYDRLFHAIQYHDMPYHAMICHTMPFDAMQYQAMLSYHILSYPILSYPILFADHVTARPPIGPPRYRPDTHEMHTLSITICMCIVMITSASTVSQYLHYND